MKLIEKNIIKIKGKIEQISIWEDDVDQSIVHDCSDESPILCVGRDNFLMSIQDHLDKYGNFSSVKYYITDKEINFDTSWEELEEEYLLSIMGHSDLTYCHAYSDLTGYLWTNRELVVGGHDLLKEILSNVGKYCYLILEANIEHNE